LGTAAATARITGAPVDEFIGWAHGPGGDVNGDGYDDLLIPDNGFQADIGESGTTFLLYGPVSGTIAQDRSGTTYIFEGVSVTAPATQRKVLVEPRVNFRDAFGDPARP